MKVAWFQEDYILKLFILLYTHPYMEEINYITFHVSPRNSILFLFRNNLSTCEVTNGIFQMIKLKPMKLINNIVF